MTYGDFGVAMLIIAALVLYGILDERKNPR